MNACQNRIYLKVFYSKEEGCRGMSYGIGHNPRFRTTVTCSLTTTEMAHKGGPPKIFLPFNAYVCILLHLACQPASSRAASWMWCSMAEIRMSTPCQP